ncbi:PREDICTED: uncharacterized protein LOC104805100 isoform X2 [Tarenaya hassleriana]|uniref:uncharacterized protein LOC104805100 isoform X2 n=1 Tax=Tarenaya hassleriana TaxID=28532 RepID=UPI00053C17A1|nr:PREDICTED: uncharacterized protein LOC104805100 isoform X2 [Tarenaya hassleriana]
MDYFDSTLSSPVYVFSNLVDLRDSGVTGKAGNEETREMEDEGVDNDFEVELDVEFCPVEHPVEPYDEDRPVKCPVPISSSVIHVERTREVRESNLLRKDQTTEALSRPIRVVRKRHHTFTGRNDVAMAPTRVPTLQTPTISQESNLTIYRVVVNEFESQI